MKNKVQDFVNKIYKGVKKNENINMQKEELYQNLMDKVNDLIAEGLKEEEAMNKVVNDFGSVDEVRNELGIYKKNRKIIKKLITIIIFIGIFTLVGFLIHIKNNQMETENNYNGLGTKDDPYIIRNVRDLKKMEEKPDSYYILNNDIDLIKEEWIPIKYFNGTIDGNDYKINNLDMALIDELGEDGIVKNVHLRDVDIDYIIDNNLNVPSERKDIGTLVNSNYGDIYNSSVSGSINVENHDIDMCLHLGLMVGMNFGSITNSYAHGGILLDSPEEKYDCWTVIGGITGQNYGIIEDVHNYVLIDSNAYGLAGGITYLNMGEIRRTIARGEIKSYAAAGGIVGDNGYTGIIENSISMNRIEAGISAGAIYIHDFGEVNNNYRLNDAKLESEKEELIIDSENKFIRDGLEHLLFEVLDYQEKWELRGDPAVKKRGNQDILVAHQIGG